MKQFDFVDPEKGLGDPKGSAGHTWRISSQNVRDNLQLKAVHYSGEMKCGNGFFKKPTM